MRQSQPIVILILIVMAIILAAGSFLALTYIQGRPETPLGTVVQTVEGLEVTLSTDPAKEVAVLNLEGIPLNTVQQDQEPAVQQPEPVEPVQEEAPTPTTEPPTPTSEPIPTPVPDPVIFEQYIVQESDSLYNIARRFDTSIALMARFGISQDDLIAGNVIRLPIGNPAYCPGGLQPYAVGEGDTAFSIGRRFNTTADELSIINNLDGNYTVYGATIICVPR